MKRCGAKCDGFGFPPKPTLTFFQHGHAAAEYASPTHDDATADIYDSGILSTSTKAAAHADATANAAAANSFLQHGRGASGRNDDGWNGNEPDDGRTNGIIWKRNANAAAATIWRWRANDGRYGRSFDDGRESNAIANASNGWSTNGHEQCRSDTKYRNK